MEDISSPLPSINKILNREQIKTDIINILKDFDNKENNIQYKKGIYIYGSSGSGCSFFAREILKEMNYDIIDFSTENVRNKAFIQTLTGNYISSYNILELMNGKKKRIAVLMDEIDGMNNGDKGGITALIKLIRQKKTKKQKLENITLNPIICIGNCYIDKKIRELMKVCNVYKLEKPSDEQVKKIIIHYFINGGINIPHDDILNPFIKNINGDFHKIKFIKKAIDRGNAAMENIIPLFNSSFFQKKSYNEDIKKITENIICHPHSLNEHNLFMNETDRTIVALLWHENVVDYLINDSSFRCCEGAGERDGATTSAAAPPASVPFSFYYSLLENIGFADYIDRITFQNQIWIFNEMSSLIKTFFNQYLVHKMKDKYYRPPEYNDTSTEIRFTKILTKYSTEYNNILFIYNLCQELQFDKKDLIFFFQELQIKYGDLFYNYPPLLQSFEKNNISKLDIKRMDRFLKLKIKITDINSAEDTEDEEENNIVFDNRGHDRDDDDE